MEGFLIVDLAGGEVSWAVSEDMELALRFWDRMGAGESCSIRVLGYLGAVWRNGDVEV